MDHIERLELALIKAAFDLSAATGSLVFSVPVQNTTPKLYACLGEPEQIRNLLGEWTTKEIPKAVKRKRAVRLVHDRNYT